MKLKIFLVIMLAVSSSERHASVWCCVCLSVCLSVCSPGECRGPNILAWICRLWFLSIFNSYLYLQRLVRHKALLKNCRKTKCAVVRTENIHWLGHKNVFSSNDHSSRTKIWYSMPVRNFILACLHLLRACIEQSTGWHHGENIFIAMFKVVNLHHNLLNKHLFDSL